MEEEESIQREILEVTQKEIILVNFKPLKLYRDRVCTETSFSAPLITYLS
jgi:hypothetical protein